jgi:phosphate uptake regulator
MHAVEQDKLTRQVAEERKDKQKADMLKNLSRASLDELFSKVEEGNISELNIIIKADVQGSVEAIKQALEKLSNKDVKVNVIHAGVGAIKAMDVMLASTSNAIIIGFNVRPDSMARIEAEKEKVEIRVYRIIYKAIEDIELADMIGIRNQQQSLEYRLITKIIERIGDHAVKIAVNVHKLDSAVSSDNPIFKMAELSFKVFESSIDSITQEDAQEINKIVEKTKNISQFGVSLESKTVGELDNIEFNMVLDSLRRVAEYSGDIAEVAINMSVNL